MMVGIGQSLRGPGALGGVLKEELERLVGRGARLELLIWNVVRNAEIVSVISVNDDIMAMEFYC